MYVCVCVAVCIRVCFYCFSTSFPQCEYFSSAFAAAASASVQLSRHIVGVCNVVSVSVAVVLIFVVAAVVIIAVAVVGGVQM